MGSQLGIYDRQDLQKLTHLLQPVADRYGNPRLNADACSQCIALLQAAVAQHPGEWIYWSSLGDFLLQAQRQADALAATVRCYWLRPTDGRSTYALASAFYQLSRARLIANMPEATARARHEQIVQAYGNVMDPFASRRDLQALGMSAQDAAAGAIHFFTATPRLVQGRDADSVRNSVAGRLREFPNLGRQPAPEQLGAALAFVDGLRPPGVPALQQATAPKAKRRWPWS